MDYSLQMFCRFLFVRLYNKFVACDFYSILLQKRIVNRGTFIKFVLNSTFLQIYLHSIANFIIFASEIHSVFIHRRK